MELAGTGAVRGPSVMVVAAGATRRMPEAAGKRRKLGVVFVSCEAGGGRGGEGSGSRYPSSAYFLSFSKAAGESEWASETMSGQWRAYLSDR